MDIQKITSDITNLLGDLNFPAHKDAIVTHAQATGASPDTVQALQQLPAQNYNSLEELVSKLPMQGIEGEIAKFI